MKKTVLSMLAAGALAAGGAASAQNLGDIVGSLFGFGAPGYGSGIPAVVAGTQPHGTVYVDPYGRHVMIDPYGRHVLVDPYGGHVMVDPYGRHAQVLPPATDTETALYDRWGRPLYGSGYGTHVYPGRYPGQRWDRDGDGVANRSDRWPDDHRYW